MATKDEPRAPRVETDPATPASRDRHLETQPGIPAPLADESLGKLAGPLPEYDFVQPESDGLDNARYEAPPRVPPAPQRVDEPNAPIVAPRPDESTHDSRRKIDVRRRALVVLVGAVVIIGALIIVRSLRTSTETPTPAPTPSAIPTTPPTATFAPTAPPSITVTPPPSASAKPLPSATVSARPSATSPVAPLPSTPASTATAKPTASSYIDNP